MIEVAGVPYIVTHVVARTYSVRAAQDGQMIGMFMVDVRNSGPQVLGAEGVDVATIVLVAEAAFAAGMIPTARHG